MTSISKLQKNYDTIVIGGGLSGLLIANQLQQSGQKTLLVDRGDSPGGFCRPHQTSQGTFPHGLKVFPHTANIESALRFIQSSLPSLDLQWQVVERAPITYEAGFKPYVGFGENSPEYIDILDHYTHPQFLELSHRPDQWVSLLSETYRGDLLSQAFITRIMTENEQVNGVIINGTKTISCQSVVFSGSPKDLPVLLGEDAMNAKARRALARSRQWTALSYDVLFDQQICEHSQMHVLTGSKDKSEACVGQFQAFDSDTGTQFSQWLTFISEAESEDSESMAAALKRIQKWMKRAYTDCFDHKNVDRISVNLRSHGQVDLPLTGHQTLTPFTNLWISSAFVHAVPHLGGAIQQTQLVLASMGFEAEPVALNLEMTPPNEPISESPQAPL